MRPIYLAIPLLTACAVLPAQNQQKLGPRSFFPREYTAEAYVNMAALVETDLWEEVERSLVTKPMFAVFRMQFGFRLSDLKELRMAMVPKKVTYSQGYESYRQQAVVVFQSQRKLSLPRPRKREWDYNRRTKDEIGGHKVVQEGIDDDENSWVQPMLWVLPQPSCLVYGDKQLIQPVLESERRGGVPHPELMAFTAGRRPLAYVAMKLRYDEKFIQNVVPFPFTWFIEDDKPTFVMLRVNVEEKTQAASLFLRLRFTDGSEGPGHFEEQLKASFKKLDTDRFLKRVPALKKFTKTLVFKKNGADLDISCDLGDARQAAELSALAQMLPMLWYTLAAVAPIPAVAARAAVLEDVEEEEEPEEEEPEEVVEEDKPKPKPKKEKLEKAKKK